MKSLLLLALLFISSLLIFSCKKDIARKMTGTYTGVVDMQDINGFTYAQTIPVRATVANATGDSILLEIGPGNQNYFSQTLRVNSKSEFGYTSLDGNHSYEGTIKGDSLIFLYTNLQPPSPGRLVYKGKRN